MLCCVTMQDVIHVFVLNLITHKEIWVSVVIMGIFMLKVIMSSDVMLSIVMLSHDIC
jgi:hypothetical protein